MKTTIYCRISSIGQAEGVSLDAQLDECKRALAANKVTDAVFVQEVCSAYENTPPLLGIVARKRNHRVVFYAVDRFARNVLNGVENARTMLKNKCELIFIRDRLVVRQAAGAEWLRLVQLITQSEAESKAISARVTGAIAYLKRNGYQYSGHVPFGFDSVQDEAKPNRKRLRVNKDEDHVLKFIVLCRTKGAKVSDVNKALVRIAPAAAQDPIVLEWSDKGVTKKLKELKYEMSYEDIAFFLNDHGLEYRGKEWTVASVSAVHLRLKKRKRQDEMDVDDVAEQMAFGFNISDESDDETYEPSDDSSMDTDDSEVKVDQSGWQVPPPNMEWEDSRDPFTTPPRRASPASPPMAPKKAPKKAAPRRK
jgi:DNA invertase Pin-like site-specific DNA recombinase